MSRFFKSAAFPILIVVVLAFFAQKLIGQLQHTRPNYTFGNLLDAARHDEQSRASRSIRRTTASTVTLRPAAAKYTVGYPDGYAPR